LDISHGDVRPLNIGYNRDSREVQILDRLNDPSPLEKLQTNNIVTKKDLYISPEVYRKLQGKDKILKYNPFKNDLYGLGLSLLAAGNLDSVQNIYKPNGDLDNANLDAHIRNFDNRYANSHPGLSKLVHNTVAPDENNRWTSQQFVDGFNGGQFSGYGATKVHAEAPVQFESGTAHKPVYSSPPATFYENPVQEQREETAVLYNADEQAQQKPADNYAYGNSQTYVYNNLATPTNTTYVSSAPTQTVYYTSPQSHYVSSVPTSYVSSGPTTYTYTTENVTSGSKPVYVSSVPTNYTTYSSAPSETIVHSPQVYSAEGTSTIINSGITTVSVTRMDGTTYTYTVDEKDREDIVRDYERHDPRYKNGEPVSVKNSYTYVPTEGTTRVESVPPTTYVYSTPPSYPAEHTVTYSTPTYKSGSIMVSSTQPVTYTNYAYTSTVNDASNLPYSIDPNVEVRRGSSNPLPVQDRSIKKKYIIEDDKVIEVAQD